MGAFDRYLLAMMFRCLDCGAHKGELCRGQRGTSVTVPHATRRSQSRQSLKLAERALTRMQRERGQAAKA